MRTRVKICGITRVEDATAVMAAGADAIGLVFYEPSPRNVSLILASEISNSIPAFVAVVGLFVDATPDYVREVCAAVRLDVLQFHGEETPAYCRQFDLPYMKAIRVKADTNLVQYALDFNDAKALLLDTYTEGMAGGTGHTFDWNLIPQDLPHTVVLAGGLNPENITQAIKQVRPYAVDVSGGVELTKGIKSVEKIAAFIQGVSNAAL